MRHCHFTFKLPTETGLMASWLVLAAGWQSLAGIRRCWGFGCCYRSPGYHLNSEGDHLYRPSVAVVAEDDFVTRVMDCQNQLAPVLGGQIQIHSCWFLKVLTSIKAIGFDRVDRLFHRQFDFEQVPLTAACWDFWRMLLSLLVSYSVAPPPLKLLLLALLSQSQLLFLWPRHLCLFLLLRKQLNDAFQVGDTLRCFPTCHLLSFERNFLSEICSLTFESECVECQLQQMTSVFLCSFLGCRLLFSMIWLFYLSKD